MCSSIKYLVLTLVQDVMLISSYDTLADGSSGSWIISSVTHNLLGQIISRRHGSGLVFFVPAHDICTDIESRLSTTVTLPRVESNEPPDQLDSLSQSGNDPPNPHPTPLTTYVSASLYGGTHLFVCCHCGDGPKVYQHQTRCVLCNHDPCSRCMLVK